MGVHTPVSSAVNQTCEHPPHRHFFLFQSDGTGGLFSLYVTKVCLKSVTLRWLSSKITAELYSDMLWTKESQPFPLPARLPYLLRGAHGMAFLLVWTELQPLATYCFLSWFFNSFIPCFSSYHGAIKLFLCFLRSQWATCWSATLYKLTAYLNRAQGTICFVC